MIKKAQIRFVAVTMSIIFAILAIFFGIAYNFIGNAVNRLILSDLYAAQHSYEVNETQHSETTLILSFRGGFSENEYAIKNGGNYFSDEQIREIIAAAKDYEEGSGAVKNVFYLVAVYGEETVLIAKDATDKLNDKKDDTVTLAIILVSVFAILFLAVSGASYSVFRPIKENLCKQRQFVSDASHEMRTPVAIISANADVLKNYVDNSYLGSIKTQTKRLETLVSDMLALAKTDEERIALAKEEFSLTDEVTEAVLPYEAVLFENGKTLVFNAGENINYVGDRQSFKAVLSILLDNAMKHSAKNATIKVSLKKEGGKPVLTVFNTGSIIRDEDSMKIFGRFYRGDESRSRDSGGSGLGLSIAKSISDANKWKITAKSKYGESMTLTVIL